MSVPAVAEEIGWQSRRVRRLPPRAAVYGVAVAFTALAATVVAAATAQAPTTDDWIAFIVLLPLAALAPLFTVSVGRNHGFHTGATFVVASALVLPPTLVVAVAVLLHVPTWVKERSRWYLQGFNIANYLLSALAAWVVAQPLLDAGDLWFALAGFCAAAVFVTVNHVLLAVMLLLARGHSFRESGLFSTLSVGLDFVIGVLGVAVAGFVDMNPWLVPVLIAPLLLAHRSLSTVALLRDSEERFRAMFESAAMATVLVGLDGRIVTANAAAEELLGYPRDELPALGEAIHPDDRDEGGRMVAEILGGERDRYRQEVRFVTATDDVVWTFLSIALVRDADAKPQFAIAMAEDVTERRILGEQLRQSQKLEAIGRLAGGVAHDFNNMLTAISGYTALSLEQAPEGSPLRADLDEVRKATDRATLLTRQLLAFSRKQVLQPELLNLNEIVVELESMLRPLIPEDIVMTMSLDPALGPIEADPSQLHQVVMNLVVNARDAMPAGGTLLIETANADLEEPDASIEPGPYVTLTVRDTGEGIDEETLDRIFEPFFTTKESGKGTGLGLATVYGIVKQSGGYVSVDSEVGVGTAFTIYLQRVDEPRSAGPEPVVANDEVRDATETVLIVEDEDVVRRLVTQVLEDEGFDVLVANNGDEALEIAGNQHVDLLVTDVMMPGLGGREVSERLRELRPDLKVVFMSGYAEGGIHSDPLQPANTEFLEKPFTFSELKDKVRGLLDS